MNENFEIPPSITERYPPLPLDELASLIRNFETHPLENKKNTIDRLVATHPLSNVDWGGEWRYRRCRRLDNGERPSTVDELIWPKGAPARLGRANPAGFQVLYLADRQDTAFQEARVTDHITVVADFGILNGRSIRVAPVGELIQIHRTGRGSFAGDHSSSVIGMINACDRAEARSLLITDAFLRQCLVGHDDYEISSHVALSIFSKLPLLNAIAYPSRRQFGAINFAVRVENFWRDWGLRSVRYGRAREIAMGFYSVSDAQAVNQIDQSGRLEWEQLDNPDITIEFRPPYTPENSV